jgi:tol-pal system protein YbgF
MVGEEVAAVRGQVEELRKAQEGFSQELARTIGDFKALDRSAARTAEEARGMSQQVARLETRLADNERAIKEVRSSVDELARRVTTLASVSPPAPPPAPRERREPQTGSAEQIYTSALNNYRARELGQAVLEFMDFIAKFPRHQLAANAQYWIGEAYYAQRDYRQALAEFQKMVEQHSKGGKVPDALLKIGLSYRALHEPGRAQETWQQLIQDYPESEAAKKARLFIQARAKSARRTP